MGIEFYTDSASEQKSYGSNVGIFTTWEFTEDYPLVGLYGTETKRGIKEFGFITLDTEC